MARGRQMGLPGPFVVRQAHHERRFDPSTGCQVTTKPPSLYLSPGGGEIEGGYVAVADTRHRPGRGVTLLRVSGIPFRHPTYYNVSGRCGLRIGSRQG